MSSDIILKSLEISQNQSQKLELLFVEEWSTIPDGRGKFPLDRYNKYQGARRRCFQVFNIVKNEKKEWNKKVVQLAWKSFGTCRTTS